MKKIKLTQNKHSLVNDRDYKKLSVFSWHTKKDRHTYYAATFKKKRGTKSGFTTITMHRMLLGKSKLLIDHINGNGLDNRRKNLRFISKLNSSRYVRKTKLKRSSIYKGVSWNKCKKLWRSYIRVNYKLMYLGDYKTEKEAAEAYNGAAKRHFGKFARLNRC